jgi:prolyl oligopeptidase
MISATALLLIPKTVMSQTSSRMRYPDAPTSNQTDDFHGVRIQDTYRPLENADAPETRKFVDEENALAQAWLAKVPGRDAVRARLTKLWDYEKFAGLFRAGGRYFQRYNSGLQNQAVLQVLDQLDATPRVLLDPNTYRQDGTAALNGVSVNWTGKLMAYSVAQAGSDWVEVRVRDVDTGKDLPDLLLWSKGGGVAWAPDDSGFYYSRFPQPPADQVLTVSALDEKLYFHKLGDAQRADRLVYELPGKREWTMGGEVLRENRGLIIAAFPGIPGKNTLAYLDLKTPGARIVDLVSTPDASYGAVEAVGNRLFVMTTDHAPKGRVIAIDLLNPARAKWREIVPEGKDTLDTVQLVGGRLVLDYMQDAHSVARMVDLDGKSAGEVAMPGIGTATWSPARSGDREMFFSFTGFATPPSYYRLDVATGKTTPVRQPKTAFDPAGFETTQVFYPSKDGTKVPMFLSHKKGLRLDGKNPTILYAYGGFNIPTTPNFSPAYAAWMEMGGVYASANLRGGSEYGEAWHQGGMREKKQNVFDDFIAAAEWLIANKYTSTPKLCIFGGSNGGLLVGAVLNQRPELFGAAMPAVGVMDMLRFHKFGFGLQWAGEYGNPDNAKDFPVLRAYSPLHNVRTGTKYPPTLITTADHDDRVMPGHSLKYAAALQKAQEGPAPILLRVDVRAGHGAGKPTAKLIDEWVDRFAFLMSALGM